LLTIVFCCCYSLSLSLSLSPSLSLSLIHNHHQPAFSRANNKKYVQHMMSDSGERLWNLISEQGAHVYVCGGTNMGKQVRETFEKIMLEFGGMTNTKDASSYIKKLQEARPQRYTQELWS
tara:strand:- start:148 stop:507 length:360 start_codon:yes stop_codon:yes gene_type:complete